MKNEEKMSRKDKFKRGIYILPNAFTTLNLFCGFLAVVYAMDGEFHFAAMAILVACIFDSLDGKVARATNTTSEFGIQYDSLADLISFGIAPSLMMYLWILKPMGRIGWLAAFLFTTCGALRLARFNTMAEETPSAHFLGLPIPGAASMIAVIVLFSVKNSVPTESFRIGYLLTIYILSFLMVSSIKYPSFKKSALFQKRRFSSLVGVVLVFTLMVQNPPLMLFSVGLIYVVISPILSFLFDIKNKHNEKVKNL